jgi:hypothetical protein
MVNSCWNHFMDIFLSLMLLLSLLLLLLRDQDEVSEGVTEHDVVESTDCATATMTGGGTAKLEQTNGYRRLDDDRRIAKQSRSPLTFMTVVGNDPTEPRRRKRINQQLAWTTSRSPMLVCPKCCSLGDSVMMMTTTITLDYKDLVPFCLVGGWDCGVTTSLLALGALAEEIFALAII